MRKIPASLIVIVLLTTVASLAARPLPGTQGAIPTMVIHANIGSMDYAVDITSTVSPFLSPERAISAIVHGLQEATAAKPDQATEPGFTHDVEAGQSVDITHTIESKAVTVNIKIHVDVGQPADVDQTVTLHQPRP